MSSREQITNLVLICRSNASFRVNWRKFQNYAAWTQAARNKQFKVSQSLLRVVQARLWDKYHGYSSHFFLTTSWRLFYTFSILHPHFRAFVPNFLTIEVRCKFLFAVHYWTFEKFVVYFYQNGGMRFWKKNQKGRQKQNCWNKASEMSNSTEIDLLITNMIIFSRLVVSFPVKVAKKSKLKKISNDWINLHHLERSCFLVC